MSEELEQLYESALKLPPEARASFAAEASVSDEKVRAELLSLVAEAERAEEFFAKLGKVVLSPPLVAEAVNEVVASRSDSRRSWDRSGEPDTLPEGLAIGRYTILERLGRGGMGTVYRARDTRLDREVALKFLYPNISSDGDAETRLLAEARAAAALQHPNICVVHEIGETSEGQPFIAMALCEGDTLKKRLVAGPVGLGEAVAIATQVLHALGAAHSRHIIHRDVKPGNIILASDGTAKLLDFGLAKSSNASVADAGFTPGTVAYMSPEQIGGEPVDHRTDLWSLGVVLYEMLAGRRPFRGESDRIVLQAILHEDPEPLRKVRASVSAHVADVVERLLRKDREARYTSAAEVLADLTHVISNDDERVESESGFLRRRRGVLLAGIAALLVVLVGVMAWSGGRGKSLSAVTAAAVAEPSIAVLPLANLSADPRDAALAVGLTEDLIATLTRAGGARVIASTSSSRFRDRKMDVRQIADSLGVSNILEGGIQKSGSRMRVEVRLVVARDGSTTWSQAYDREFKDMFSMQDEIVRAVAAELGLRFDKERQLRRHGTRSIAAYELYLRGSDPRLFRSQNGAWKSLEFFQQAIAVDSTYAAAHAGLAMAQLRRGGQTNDPGMPLPQLFALAERSARKAVALDDSLPEAHLALGRVLAATLDFPSAETETRRAINLDPTRSVYHRWLATLHAWAGRPEEELAEARRALETDPLNPYVHWALAEAFFDNGRFSEALTQLGLVAAIQPPLQGAVSLTAQIYAQQQRLPEAIAMLRPPAEAGDPMFRGLLGCLLARAGQRDEANGLLADLLVRRERTGIGAFQVAMVQAGLGDLDQAFIWLDKSVDDLSINSMVMGPNFEDLQRDPRFQKLKERLGLRR
jgi:TolB-like protein/Flp pilus assembly protein TadD